MSEELSLGTKLPKTSGKTENWFYVDCRLELPLNQFSIKKIAKFVTNKIFTFFLYETNKFCNK